jgi:hypothetical protein
MFHIFHFWLFNIQYGGRVKCDNLQVQIRRHLMHEHRSNAGIPSGCGGAVSANWIFDDRWLPFVRAGWFDGGGGAPQEKTASTGIGYYLHERTDLVP